MKYEARICKRKIGKKMTSQPQKIIVKLISCSYNYIEVRVRSGLQRVRGLGLEL